MAKRCTDELFETASANSLPVAEKPLLIIVMGVSGSGKSTIAQLLVNALNLQLVANANANLNHAETMPCYHFIDADDFHDEQAKAMMAKQMPLTEQQRLPWINRMAKWLMQRVNQQQHYVLAYSGLKKHHRDTFNNLGFRRLIIHLKVSQQQLLGRLTKRSEQTNHFMPASMLTSQFKDFEAIRGDEKGVIEIDADQSPDEVIAEIMQCLVKYQCEI